MSLRGRVGRHARQGGRHCQNRIEDQQAVIALLNRIPAGDGGAGGGLNGNIAGRMVAGMASETLYAAILRFEDKHFPGQRSGFVDPGGAMLRRMQDLAARAAAAANDSAPVPLPPIAQPPTSLERLRAHVLSDASSKPLTPAQKAEFAPLVAMAVKHIDDLIGQGHTRLPWMVELFGRAHTTRDMLPIRIYGPLEFVIAGGKRVRRSLPEMRFGAPVDILADVTTEHLGALLLYDSAVCERIPPHHTAMIRMLGQPGPWGVPRPLER